MTWYGANKDTLFVAVARESTDPRKFEATFENNGAWMSWLAQSWSHPDRLERIRALTADYESITREDIVALAETYLQPQDSWRVTILPRDGE